MLISSTMSSDVDCIFSSYLSFVSDGVKSKKGLVCFCHPATPLIYIKSLKKSLEHEDANRIIKLKIKQETHHYFLHCSLLYKWRNIISPEGKKNT